MVASWDKTGIVIDDDKSQKFEIGDDGVPIIEDDTFIRNVLKDKRYKNVTKVVIPNNITSIGEYAFYNCTSLTSINIPNSVTEIKESAFEDCVSLTSIDIPDSITNIGKCAFLQCHLLKNVFYKGVSYTSVSKLTKAMRTNDCSVGDNIFIETLLSD